MWKPVVLILVALTALAALRRSWGWLLRRRALAGLDPEGVLRLERGVPIRALLYGTPPMLGMNPKRANRLKGDLALTEDRFLLTSSRGLLADLGPEHGRRFTSVRCTGPGRLVIEGDVPRSDGAKGLYRFELVVDDAPGWAEALSPFVREDEEGRRFARRPPRMPEDDPSFH
jgi:hypothetical protein